LLLEANLAWPTWAEMPTVADWQLVEAALLREPALNRTNLLLEPNLA